VGFASRFVGTTACEKIIIAVPLYNCVIGVAELRGVVHKTEESVQLFFLLGGGGGVIYLSSSILSCERISKNSD
jgi:hypothetical protein